MEKRRRIPLSGDWKFAMDPMHQAITFCGGWYDYDLPDTVQLPGTTDTNLMGVKATVKDIDHANSLYQYVGSAWYQKELDIPEELEGKRIMLFMERTARTQVWVDKTYIGKSDKIQVPQLYDMGKMLYPGHHKISIECDNSPVRPLQFGQYVQNGVSGGFYLEITDQVWIEHVKLTTDTKLKRVFVNMWIGNNSGLPVEGRFRVDTASQNGRHELAEKWVDFRMGAEDTSKMIRFEILLGENMLTWDEFDPNVYSMHVDLIARSARSAEYEYRDEWNGTFGMRDFKVDGTQISVNGNRVFLRGDLSGPARYSKETDLYKMWMEKLSVYKQYGINHLRLHSSCPTEDGFRAADEMGIYLQVELPLWANIAAPDSPQYEPLLEPTLNRHGEYLLQEYGNHPSFCMLSLGNEHSGYRDTLENVVDHLRKYNLAHMYAQGSNAFLDDPSQSKADDFWVTMRLHEGHYPTRGSFSHADPPIGPVQDEAPNTMTDFSASMAWSTIPVIGHEIGQYETSPNFDDIDKFPEDVIPGNLILFRDIMKEHGLLDMEKEFFKASGKLCLDCYRQDLEMFLRTRGFAGFQMLGLSDCLGQGSSLVGILNIFMESKGMVTPEDWRKFCSERVLLLRIPKYTWYANETFTGLVQMANYGPGAIDGAKVAWKLTGAGKVLAEGSLEPQQIPQGTLFDLGCLSIKLDMIQKPCAARLDLAIENTPYVTDYPLWVFPEAEKLPGATDVHISHGMDDETCKVLQNGGRVLMFPRKLSPDKFVEGYYASNFWSYTMFRNMSLDQGKTVMPGTLGLYIDKNHPMFDGFPTEQYSQWHWWHIVQNASPIILNDLPASYKPAVQVIDNPMRCARLGLLFEAKVGAGRLLICTSQLEKCDYDPAAHKLHECLLRYTSGDQFAPGDELSIEDIKSFF